MSVTEISNVAVKPHLSGLPTDLVDQLSKKFVANGPARGKLLEQQIKDILNADVNEAIDCDAVLIAYYNKHTVVIKRTNMVNLLGKMANEKQICSPSRGLYQSCEALTTP